VYFALREYHSNWTLKAALKLQGVVGDGTPVEEEPEVRLVGHPQWKWLNRGLSSRPTLLVEASEHDE